MRQLELLNSIGETAVGGGPTLVFGFTIPPLYKQKDHYARAWMRYKVFAMPSNSAYLNAYFSWNKYIGTLELAIVYNSGNQKQKHGRTGI